MEGLAGDVGVSKAYAVHREGRQFSGVGSLRIFIAVE